MIPVSKYFNDGSGDVDLSSRNKEQLMSSVLYCIISIVLFSIAFLIRDPNIANLVPFGDLGIIAINVIIIVSIVFLCIWQGIPCSKIQRRRKP
ncbi:MAG: hypothetical protein GF411_15810 [Candidatus Lokiarchaeota archaeon]|nr:hypothetical protein [Candidatus Lokiarchaeota archaeon]